MQLVLILVGLYCLRSAVNRLNKIKQTALIKPQHFWFISERQKKKWEQPKNNITYGPPVAFELHAISRWTE